jgi:hypothetical protein
MAIKTLHAAEAGVLRQGLQGIAHAATVTDDAGMGRQ